MPVDYPSQNAGKPTGNAIQNRFRRSCLASPQMAGIPTKFNDNDTATAPDNWRHTDGLHLSGLGSKNRK